MYNCYYLVLTVVNLSLKLMDPSKVFKVSDLEHILLTLSDQEYFTQFEQDVLELFEFDLYFDNNLNMIFSSECCKFKEEEIMFLC